MIVPLHLQLGDGRTVRLLDITLKGDTVSDHVIKLGKLPVPPKDAVQLQR